MRIEKCCIFEIVLRERAQRVLSYHLIKVPWGIVNGSIQFYKVGDIVADPGILVGSGYCGRIPIFRADPDILFGSGSGFRVIKKLLYQSFKIIDKYHHFWILLYIIHYY